jgi:hypothetical protein
MSESLLNQPVMSLRASAPIALAVEPIINPHNLKILGWWCKAHGNGQLVLLTEDVREIMPSGLAINDEDDLVRPQDLARHREVLQIDFQLINKPVKTKRQKLGKVSDYSYNDGLFVQKLYVARPLVKVFTADDTLIIDRVQVLEVTDNYILVRDTEVTATEEELATAPGIMPAA